MKIHENMLHEKKGKVESSPRNRKKPTNAAIETPERSACDEHCEMKDTVIHGIEGHVLGCIEANQVRGVRSVLV